MLEALKNEIVGKDYLLENGIEALEKQVPKKPLTRKAEKRTEGRYHVFFGPGTTLYHCPACGELLTPSMDYCDGCGQRMNWSDQRKAGPR